METIEDVNAECEVEEHAEKQHVVSNDVKSSNTSLAGIMI